VSEDIWALLASPFALESLQWRIIRLSEDGQRAQLRPQLRAGAVVARLDEVAGVEGWSNHLTPFGEALICTLSVGSVSKSAVSDAPLLKPAERAEDALVRAAELYGMRPPADQKAEYWVDYNPEAEEILYEPELQAPVHAPAPEPQRSEGQRAIDRLVERLKEDGLGLEAAKLVSAYGGYGSSSEQARELYGRLRALLKDKPAP
jgi:hypothetical protein